jgi:hypothetical protein
MERLLGEPENSARRSAVLSLVGLRRAIFPDGPDFRSPLMAPPQNGIAA